MRMGLLAQALDEGSDIVPEDKLTGAVLGKRVATFLPEQPPPRVWQRVPLMGYG